MENINKIVIFDGVCNLCNRLVFFIIKHDKEARILFTYYQSGAAKQLREQYNFTISTNESIIYIDDGCHYYKSTAILKILKDLGRVWRFFYILIAIPRPIRDWMYSRIANNRYKLFGKRDTCMVPSEKIKNRFIS